MESERSKQFVRYSRIYILKNSRFGLANISKRVEIVLR